MAYLVKQDPGAHAKESLISDRDEGISICLVGAWTAIGPGSLIVGICGGVRPIKQVCYRGRTPENLASLHCPPTGPASQYSRKRTPKAVQDHKDETRLSCLGGRRKIEGCFPARLVAIESPIVS